MHEHLPACRASVIAGATGYTLMMPSLAVGMHRAPHPDSWLSAGEPRIGKRNVARTCCVKGHAEWQLVGDFARVATAGAGGALACAHEGIR